jgi:hypothetical protein
MWFKPRLPALILDAIVQKRRNGEVLIAAVFEDCRCDGLQMCDIGGRGSLAHLPAVDMRGVEKRAIKPVGENRRDTNPQSPGACPSMSGWFKYELVGPMP